MTIELKEDVAYILLKKMGDRPEATQPLNLTPTDFVGRNTNHTEILAHLDYLNQKGYINADFEGDAYADAGPNPLPDSIQLQAAELTESGQQLLERMSNQLPKGLKSGPSVEIATKDMDFLKKVMLKGNLDNLYDARDITEVVFRTMRDLMPTEGTKRVAKELKTASVHTKKKALQKDISELWKDSNPLVRFLSDVRPALNFDDETFLFRVEREGGIPKSTGPNTILRAVFGATKDELSAERITEISQAMPGKIRELWEEA
ncbi:MAG: DUF2267 domain-containing protein [Cyanobacteria bacterium P01_F01_bin.53]